MVCSCLWSLRQQQWLASAPVGSRWCPAAYEHTEEDAPLESLPLSLHYSQQWCLASLAGPGFFLDSLGSGKRHPRPSGCLHTVNPMLSPASDSQSPSLRIQPRPLQWMSLSSWGVPVNNNCLYSSLFGLPSPNLLLCFLQRLQSSPCDLANLDTSERTSLCVEKFPPSQLFLPPSGTGPVLILFLSFSFCPTQLRGDTLALL